ncbi:MAG: hypothetical protein ABSC22_05870 [Roseiarcus sp.]
MLVIPAAAADAIFTPGDHADCRALGERLAAASGASISEDVGVRVGLSFPPGHVFARNHVDVTCPVGAYGPSVIVLAEDPGPDAALLMLTLAGALGHILTGDSVQVIFAGATKCITERRDGTWDFAPIRLPASELVCGPTGRTPIWVEVDKLGLAR